MTLEGGVHATTLNAEDLEEIGPERLRLASFTALRVPVMREARRSVPDVVGTLGATCVKHALLRGQSDKVPANPLIAS